MLAAVSAFPRVVASRSIAASSRLSSLGASARKVATPKLIHTAGLARCYSTESKPDSGQKKAAVEPSEENETKPESVQKEATVGPSEKHEFKAETKKLLHIVAHSLYSQREVFVRELVSNASDALEKLRHLQVTSHDASSGAPMEIRINVDADKKTLEFSDSGIGMTEDELKQNLGTIARSGSKAYIENMENSADSKDAANTIVGQFGVGFYSAFMVGDDLTVYTRSATPGSQGYCWKSDGLGSYTISKAENVPIGTKIVIGIRDDAKEFLDADTLKGVIKKYSNFVGFPISVNGEKVNTVEALWTKDKNSISEEEHENFYRFVSHAWDKPMYQLVYKADGPISIRSILYTPTNNPEGMGFDRIKPGVSLYSRKVLIMPNAKGILPEWLRFVQGVVDSEDLPLNLSRELLQNGPVIARLKLIITSRIIKWLQEESRKDADKFGKFFNTFGVYIKEGVCQDLQNQKEIAKLLRFETSSNEAGKLIALSEYVERMPSDQKYIYYFCTPKRQLGEDSPYYEPFKKHGTEVLFLHHPLDEFVMGRLEQFEGKKLVSVDSEEASKELKRWSEEEMAEDGAKDDSSVALTKEQSDELTSWMLSTFGTKVKEVKVSDRYMTYPAIVTDFDSPAVRNMMKMMAGNSGTEIPQRPCVVEINAKDPIVNGLYSLKSKDEGLARKVSQQLLDNAYIAAGILDDPRVMLKRLNDIIAAAVVKN
ncbi:hypothetical protein EV179_000429 [Coemansia sp. RSA 487]|nr:hypothetical protein LPJ74_002407 [Coemansia sp. RSA 1843]KAJ2093140.1 hypothetical protein IW138_000432 [Coemansia sp. RSA 986]KAJ2217594.1 hypothetical protein EV179_000429 [Coemansia sp. RSA 487]